MAIHAWWGEFGEAVTDLSKTPASVQQLARVIGDGVAGAAMIEIRHCAVLQLTAVRIDVDVERPQDLAHAIKSTEPIAVVFSADPSLQPSVLALRKDFPEDIAHQNETPEGVPCSLCVDDRPWSESRLSWTPVDCVRRVQHWLAKAARGELHDRARPLDPIFFRAERTLVVPRGALQVAGTSPIELVGFVRHDDQRVVMVTPIAELKGKVPERGRLLVLALRVNAQRMGRLRHAPQTIAGLATEMSACGVDLVKEIKTRTAEWAGLDRDDLRRLASRLAILVAFPIRGEGGETIDDLRGFVTRDTIGEIGVKLGTLLRNTSGVGAKAGYVTALGGTSAAQADGLAIEPVEVHLAFDRELGAAMAGGTATDKRRVVLVGAGALGSQLSLNLAREGVFNWTIVDNDRLMPHNLARHGLFEPYVGLPKAEALAAEISALLSEPAEAIVSDVTAPASAESERLAKALNTAEIIIDSSASIAAARHLSDLAESDARRVSLFFNPAGTDVVLLTEAHDRSLTLSDLEAQYHRLVISEPDLAGHLRVEQSGLRYSGSCRALSNRIPASRASLLSALASMGLRDALAKDQASIQIWRLTEGGEVRLVSRAGQRVTCLRLGEWDVIYDDGLLADPSQLRADRLPNETGGVLLGLADMSRRSLRLVAALQEPSDSIGSVSGFERGVSGLVETVKDAVEASLHQVRYVGEWHSHPRRASPLPSSTDLLQLAWLRRELEIEGLPALMAIAADDGKFAFVLADELSESGSGDAVRRVTEAGGRR